MKYTSSISNDLFNKFVQAYKNNLLNKDDWSQMTKALRKRIKRNASR